MTKPLVTNASNVKQVKNASIKERFSRRQQIEDLRAILSSPNGRRFLWRYLDECGVFRSSYDASGSKVYFNEGIRNVGNKLLSEITEANPKAFAEMMFENSKLDEEQTLEEIENDDTSSDDEG